MAECSQGIKNAMEIEKLDQRTTLMIKQMGEGIERLDKKFDQLEKEIKEWRADIPRQIHEAVDSKWKVGVYGVVKWLVITVAVAVIGVVVRLVIGV